MTRQIKIITKQEVKEMIIQNNKHLRKRLDVLMGRLDLVERTK